MCNMTELLLTSFPPQRGYLAVLPLVLESVSFFFQYVHALKLEVQFGGLFAYCSPLGP